MNRLFDDVFSRSRFVRTIGQSVDGRPIRLAPARAQRKKAVTVSAQLPGLTEKDVQVEIGNGVLSIRGEKKAERSDESKFVSECYYGSFQRQIPLKSVEEDKAQADFKNGVLTVTIPKSEQSNSNVKRIAINTN